MILVILVTSLLYLAFFRTVNEGLFGEPRRYTEQDRAEGRHCIDLLVEDSTRLRDALAKRFAAHDIVVVRDMNLGPLTSDGTHKMTIKYNIDRIGERSTPPKSATGIVSNLDCAFTLQTVQL